MSDRSNPTLASRGRADFPAGAVIFLIGMRVNSPWRIRSWLPVFMAMPRMLEELFQHPELGLLDARNEFAWRRATVIQYWESMDKLMAYAAARDREHLPAWKAYNASVKRSGPVVGVWHEAYEVHPSASHTVYRNMPQFGLAAATRNVAASESPEPAVQSHPAP